MSTDEWLEIVEWVNTRFTPGWTVDRAAAFGIDLKDYAAEDVWDALYRLNERGLEYAPNGSQLGRETVVVVRERIERARYEAQGLPGPPELGPTLSQWLASEGYESWDDAVAAAHRRIFAKGCVHADCDVCGNAVDKASPVSHNM